MQRRVAARTAACVFLQAFRVRSAIGAQKKAIALTGRGIDQRLPMSLALEHRQTIHMRPSDPLEQSIAVVQQMLGGNRSSHRPPCLAERTSAGSGTGVTVIV